MFVASSRNFALDIGASKYHCSCICIILSIIVMSTPIGRSGHIVASCGNFVLVWGGYTNNVHEQERYVSSHELWVYSLSMQQWLKLKTSGMIPQGLSGASAVVVGMLLYVICGHGPQGNSNETYCLDLCTLNWERLDTGEDDRKPSPRDKCTAWHYNKSIYIFGGFGLPLNHFLHDAGTFFRDDSTANPQRGWNNQLLQLNLADREWSNPACKGCVPSPRAAHAVAHMGDKAFVFGGRHDRYRLNDLYALDMNTLQWSSLTPSGETPQGRSWHSLTVASKSSLFLYGGFSQENTPLGDIWQYDIVLNTWNKMGTNEDKPRLWHSSCACENGTIAVFGGCSTNILDFEVQDIHCNDLMLYRISPNSLVQISLDTVFENRSVLEPEWETLPHNLREQLNMRKAGFRLQWGSEGRQEASSRVVCVIM